MGYSDIFIRSFFWGFQILNSNIFGGFQKKNDYFLRYEDFVHIFGDHHKIGLYLGVTSMHFRIFSEGQGFQNFKYFLGVLEIPDIFGV